MTGYVSAVSWSASEPYLLRVYKVQNDQIIERYYDANRWITGDFKAAGTKVAATAWVENRQARIRVYVCDHDDWITEHYWKNGEWSKNNSFPAIKGQDVSAVSYLKNGKPRIRVYVYLNGEVVEKCSDDGGENWYEGLYKTS